jgi:8-oxo-dGTP diphosphatase
MGEHTANVRAVARLLIQNEAGELLLCRNRSGQAWVPPGGTLDPGETLADAALREAIEEVGIRASLGPMVYLQEFRPADRDEHVIEVAFQAQATFDHPSPKEVAAGRITPVGPAERPWSSWQIQDLDGPLRLVRWFTQAALAQESDPIYPDYLRQRYWNESLGRSNGYLGLVVPRR